MRDGTDKLPTPDSHVNGENGAKIIVYKTKRDSKEEEDERKTKKSERLKKYNSKKKELKTIDHTIRAQLRMLFVFVHV